MRLDDYQGAAERTAHYPADNQLMALQYLALGLAGEAGEVANELKKVIRDDQGVLLPAREVALMGEVGDVLWYVSEICRQLGYCFSDIAQANLDKLAARHG